MIADWALYQFYHKPLQVQIIPQVLEVRQKERWNVWSTRIIKPVWPGGRRFPNHAVTKFISVVADNMTVLNMHYQPSKETAHYAIKSTQRSAPNGTRRLPWWAHKPPMECTIAIQLLSIYLIATLSGFLGGAEGTGYRRSDGTNATMERVARWYARTVTTAVAGWRPE